MKKLAFELTAITIIVLYFTIHFTYMLREPTLEKTNLMGFYAEPQNTLDVVFIGSSTLRSSINPLVLWEEYGITSYDMATSSQRPSGIIWMLKEALKYQKEAIYVIDVNNIRFDEEFWDKQNEGSIRHITDGLKYSWNRLGCINSIVREGKVSYYLDIIKYHNNIKNGLDFRTWNYECSNPYKGFHMLTDISASKPVYCCSDKMGSLPEYGESVLREILRYCRNTRGGVKVEFIISEQHVIDYSTCQYIKSIIEEYGYTCFIFNEHEEEMGIDGMVDFYDDLHTNISGSEKCSLFYGKYLSEKYFLFVRQKEEDVIDDWNRCVIETKEACDDARHKMMQLHLTGLNDMEVDVRFDKDIGIFQNTTLANKDLEYAWSIYEVIDGNKELVDSMWYTDNNTFEYEFDVEKTYNIVSFVRLKDDTDVGTYDAIVIQYNENEEMFESTK